MATVNVDSLPDPALLDDLEPLPHPGRKLSEDEFFRWCQGFECVRAEWVDGETIIMSPVSMHHDDLQNFLAMLFRTFVEHHDLGRIFGSEAACRFQARGRRVIRVPDLLFVAKANLGRIKRTYLDGAPDLAIEIVSPDSPSRDYREKHLDYQSGGVREYWIIDPLPEKVETWLRDEASGEFRPVAPADDGRLCSTIIPGLFLRPEWLWSDPTPRVADILRLLQLV